MGPQQFFLSWPFPGVIHYSATILLLGVVAGSQPSTADAKPGLPCARFTFISVKLHPLLTPVLSSFRNPPQVRSQKNRARTLRDIKLALLVGFDSSLSLPLLDEL